MAGEIVLKKNDMFFWLDMLVMSLFLFGITVQSSMMMYLHTLVPTFISLICLASRCYFLVSFFFRHRNFKWQKILLYFISVAVVILFYITTGMWSLFDLFFAALFMQNHQSEKVRKVIFWVIILSVLMIMMLSIAHITPDISFARTNGRKRYGFGFSHPNGFSRMVLIAVLIDVLSRKQKIRYRNIAIYMFAAFFVYYFPNTVTVAGLIGIVSVILFFNKFSKNRISSSTAAMVILCIGMVFVTGFFISLAVLYAKNKLPDSILPDTIGSRFELGMRGFDKYGIEWLGNKDIEFVSSAASNSNGQEYFVLDSLIFYMPIRMGLAVTFVFIFMYVCSVAMYFKKRNFFGILVMLSVCIYSLFENAILTSYAFTFAFMFFDANNKGKLYGIKRLLTKRLKIEDKYKTKLHISDDI